MAIAEIEADNGYFAKADDSLCEAQGCMEKAYGKAACNEEFAALLTKRGNILTDGGQDQAAKQFEVKARKKRDDIMKEKKILLEYINSSQHHSKG